MVLLLIVFPVYTYLTALTSKRWQKLEAEKNSHIDIAGGRFAEAIGEVKVVALSMRSFARLGFR